MRSNIALLILTFFLFLYQTNRNIPKLYGALIMRILLYINVKFLRMY